MTRFGSIYLITNKLDGQQYVGQTENTVQQRFYDHSRDKRSSRYLSSAMIKHGKENFKIEEICVCFDENSLNNAETACIQKFNTLHPNGYNLSLGGHKRGVISELTRKKMSDAKKGKTYTKKIRPDEQQKLNASTSRGGSPVLAINLLTGEQKLYRYVRETEKDGFNNADIYRVLNGQRRHTKNWFFTRDISKYDNQNGSREDNTSQHVQRIGDEPTSK